eukprot:scaffold9199_cov81-Skeletonema_marinoi.AAC.4
MSWNLNSRDVIAAQKPLSEGVFSRRAYDAPGYMMIPTPAHSFWAQAPRRRAELQSCDAEILEHSQSSASHIISSSLNSFIITWHPVRAWHLQSASGTRCLTKT